MLTNLFGSSERAARALGGVPVESRAQGLRQLLAVTAGASAAERLQRLVAAVPQQSVTPDWREATGDFSAIPALLSWPGDGGRSLTLPLIVTRHPESGVLNWGMYRVQLLDAHRAAICWRPESGAAQHHAAWRARGEAMPVAIVLGAPPALLWAAGAPLPATVDEADFVGLVTGTPLPLAGCESCDLSVPAVAEAVIEGTVAPDELVLAGPFGNHTGAYVAAAPAPVLRLTLMHQRRDLLYPCTVVGPPPMEDCYLAKVTERLLLPLMQCDLPQLVDLSMPLEGIFHGCALVAVQGDDAAGELCARLRRNALLRAARLIVLFDAATDVHDHSAAFWRVINRVQPERDLRLYPGALDIDARRLPQSPLLPDPDTARLLLRRGAAYGLPEHWLS